MKREKKKKYLVESFEFVSSVSESSYSVNIEGVFSLTYGGDSFFQLGDVSLLVCLLAVVYNNKKRPVRGLHQRFANRSILHYKDQHWRGPARRFFSCLACSSLLSVWKARGGPLGKNGGNFSDSSCCWIRWNSLRLAGTTEKQRKHQLLLT